MTWVEDGLTQQTEFLKKIEGKLEDGKALTGFERMFYKVEVGGDYLPQDEGEERVIRYQE